MEEQVITQVHGNSFWNTEATKRSEAALDIWASAKRSQIEGCRGVPTIDAIFGIEDPSVDELGNPLHDSDKPNRIRVLRKEEHPVVDEGIRRWVVMVTEEFVERHKDTSTIEAACATRLMMLTVDAWLVDIGNPSLLPAFLMTVYPKRGPYEVSQSDFDPAWLYGNLRPGRSASKLTMGYGALHRSAIRSLGDFLADFGLKRVEKPAGRVLRVNGEIVKPKGGDPGYGVATAAELEDAKYSYGAETGRTRRKTA